MGRQVARPGAAAASSVFTRTPAISWPPAELMPIPDDVDARDAVLLASMETAVTLTMDGRPAMGERVVVFGQGIVGLLPALLSRYR